MPRCASTPVPPPPQRAALLWGPDAGSRIKIRSRPSWPVKSYPVRVDFGLTPRPLRKAEIEEKTKVRLGPGTPGALNVDDTANLYFYGPGPPGAVKRPSRSLS